MQADCRCGITISNTPQGLHYKSPKSVHSQREGAHWVRQDGAGRENSSWFQHEWNWHQGVNPSSFFQNRCNQYGTQFPLKTLHAIGGGSKALSVPNTSASFTLYTHTVCTVVHTVCVYVRIHTLLHMYVRACKRTCTLDSMHSHTVRTHVTQWQWQCVQNNMPHCDNRITTTPPRCTLWWASVLPICGIK